MLPLPELPDVLSRYWGYSTFRPLQREAMDAVLAGRDSIVVLPTGGGKSLCFQAPAVMQSGLALVVSPLISLMKDQVDTLVGNGVPAALYNSSLTPDEKAQVIAGLRQGRYRLLYVSPERLVGDGSESFLNILASCRRRLRRRGRSPLHQPVGPRFQARVPAARQAAAASAGGRSSCLHGDSDRPHPAGHRRPTRPERPGRARRIVRSPEPRLSRAAPGHAQEAADRGAQPPPPRSRHRLLHVAAGNRGARGVAGDRAASPRSRITPVCRTRNAAATRTPSSASAPTSSSPPSRSAWASIGPTFASSSTRARLDRSSITSRSRDARDAMASRPSAC